MIANYLFPILLKLLNLFHLRPDGRCYTANPNQPCRCVNIIPKIYPSKGNLFRTREIWLVVSLTTACLGIFVCLIFLFWIACCKATNCFTSRILDGSQAVTMLILLGLILLFASVFPFSFHASPIICALRANCVPLAYAFLFSTMLSRSGM